MDSWCTIESDPGVFTELIQKFGVEGVQVEELYSLDEEEFTRYQPIYGLVFLFKYTSDTDERETINTATDEPDLFFANQVIPNACATQAILSVLLNSSGLALGDTLTQFKSFADNFASDLKGLAISNSDPIRTAHNSFARPEPFVMEESKTATDKDDVFHFIAYIPFNGSVYELDGLKSGPIKLGAGDDWLSIARPAIQARMERYSSSEIRFNLMAIIRNRKDTLTDKLSTHEAILSAIESARGGGEAMDSSQLGDFELATDKDGLDKQSQETLRSIEELKGEIQAEEEKFEKWHTENIRRKHNYIPFVVNLFRMLAEKGHLRPMIEKAQQAKREGAPASS